VLFQLANTRNPIVNGGTVKAKPNAGRSVGHGDFRGENARR